jgi:lipopolysaccharide heptosyltransferase II
MKSSGQKKILVFELNWLGDILFSFPFLRALRKRFPEAYIACVVVPRYLDLLVNNPWINDVRAFSDEHGIHTIKEKIAFIDMIRKEHYDTCFLLKPSRTKALMAALAGINRRIGFTGKSSAINYSVEFPRGEVHRADQILSLAGAVGVTKADGAYEYFLSAMDAGKCEEVLHGAGGGLRRTIVINPGGNWAAKRWPVEKYKQLVKRMISAFNDVEVVITGSRKDSGLGDEISAFVNDKRCYSIAGQTTLNELAAIFKKSELVISADSGPLHLASAIGARTIGLFGPTSYKITGPRGRQESVIIRGDCGCDIPCYVEKCEKNYVCMRNIKVDEVFSAVRTVLLKNE